MTECKKGMNLDEVRTLVKSKSLYNPTVIISGKGFMFTFCTSPECLEPNYVLTTFGSKTAREFKSYRTLTNMLHNNNIKRWMNIKRNEENNG